jgi:hypothetical protein
MEINRADRLKRVYDDIGNTCIRAGRKPEEVVLVAVSKTFPAEVVREVYDAGMRIFGESRAQEFRDKSPLLPADIQWHFIGHLQKNKIKYVVPEAELIHSVDSLQLARAVSDYAQKKGVTTPILMEVNTSGEEAKFGTAMDSAIDDYLEIHALPGIVTRGFMTMAPFTDDDKVIRLCFSRLRQIRDALARQLKPEYAEILSMGMTNDFHIAIEEGSTMIRIGTAIFGSRGR